MAHAICQRFGWKGPLTLGFFVLAAIYLFATRPTPLQAEQVAGRTVPVEVVFRIVAAENDAPSGDDRGPALRRPWPHLPVTGAGEARRARPP